MYSLFPSFSPSQSSVLTTPKTSHQKDANPLPKRPKPTTKFSKKLIRKSGIPKRNYMKFCPTKLDELNTIYEKNHYPSKDEMHTIAQAFKEKLSKIENWFKHKRRKEVQIGLMKFEKKKVFTKDEIQVLMQEFLRNKNPNSNKYQEIAYSLQCQVKHVKNWFSYKRKVLLKLSRNPKLSLKPKQEVVLEKLLDETTSKLRRTTIKLEKTAEKLEKTISKIENIEEKSKVIIKIEEERKKTEETPNQKHSEPAKLPLPSQENLMKNWMTQQFVQLMWMEQMNQNYAQMYQNWNIINNLNRFKGMEGPKTD